MSYRSLALAVVTLASMDAVSADAQSVYVAPGGVYIAGGPVYVTPAPSFDLRHLRYVSYLNNAEGRAALSEALQARMQTILGH